MSNLGLYIGCFVECLKKWKKGIGSRRGGGSVLYRVGLRVGMGSDCVLCICGLRYKSRCSGNGMTRGVGFRYVDFMSFWALCELEVFHLGRSPNGHVHPCPLSLGEPCMRKTRRRLVTLPKNAITKKAA